METSLFDAQGDPVAYLSDDYDRTIYLWDGHPVAYLYEEQHVYGFNGRHLGWFIQQVLYDENGGRSVLPFVSCPTAVAKEPDKRQEIPTGLKSSRVGRSPRRPNLGF